MAQKPDVRAVRVDVAALVVASTMALRDCANAVENSPDQPSWLGLGAV